MDRNERHFEVIGDSVIYCISPDGINFIPTAVGNTRPAHLDHPCYCSWCRSGEAKEKKLRNAMLKIEIPPAILPPEPKLEPYKKSEFIPCSGINNGCSCDYCEIERNERNEEL